MRPLKIKDGIYWVGNRAWSQRLFDLLTPLPDGTSYNAYLLQGSQKTALIDTIEPHMAGILLGHLKQLGVKHIDYVIANHAEQDHSGALPQILEQYPQAQIICTPKCKDMLLDFELAPEKRFATVNDGETLSLGNRTLEFIHTPWVHWPETMVTYLQEDQILFSCDFFGSHLATTDLYAGDKEKVYEAAKRYYAGIMMPYHKIIAKNLQKVQEREISLIAPSHGPLYENPDFILNAYHNWIHGKAKNTVVLPYISIHGSTHKVVKYLVGALVEHGIKVELFDLTVTDIGKFAMALVDASTLVIGSPTVLSGAHPDVVHAVYTANILRPNTKFISLVGSYGWSSTKMVKQLTELTSNLKAEMLTPVMVKGYPKEEDFEALDQLAASIAEKHKNQLSL